MRIPSITPTVAAFAIIIGGFTAAVVISHYFDPWIGMAVATATGFLGSLLVVIDQTM